MAPFPWSCSCHGCFGSPFFTPLHFRFPHEGFSINHRIIEYKWDIKTSSKILIGAVFPGKQKMDFHLRFAVGGMLPGWQSLL